MLDRDSPFLFNLTCSFKIWSELKFCKLDSKIFPALRELWKAMQAGFYYFFFGEKNFTMSKKHNVVEQQKELCNNFIYVNVKATVLNLSFVNPESKKNKNKIFLTVKEWKSSLIIPDYYKELPKLK